MKKTAIVLAAVFGTYLVVRAGVELVRLDYHDPASYRQDWGGPSLVGVLGVHVGPGLAALVGAAVCVRTRLHARSATLGRS